MKTYAISLKKIWFSQLFLLAMTANNFASDWVELGTESGIKISKKEVQGSPILAFRGEGDVDASIEKVAAVIFDTTRAPEWVVDLEKSEIVRWVSQNEFIEYDHIKTPPIIMKDRDFVSLVKMTINKNTKEINFHYKSIDEPSIPQSRNVRGDLMNTTFILTPKDGDKKTHVIGEIHCDPKGQIPVWITNFFQKDWPTNTLKNLRAQVLKKDIVINQKILSLFEEVKLKQP